MSMPIGFPLPAMPPKTWQTFTKCHSPAEPSPAPESTRRDRTLDATLQTSFLRAASRFGKLASPFSHFAFGQGAR